MSDRHGNGISPAGPIGLRELLDSAPDLVFCCNADGRFEWVSARAESLTGFKPNELLGRLHTTVLPEREWSSVARFYLRQMRRGLKVTQRDVTIVTRDGRELSGSVRIRVLQRMDGDLVLVGTARERNGAWDTDGRRAAFMPPAAMAEAADATAEVAALQAELEAMRARWQAAEQARDRMVVGHERDEAAIREAHEATDRERERAEALSAELESLRARVESLDRSSGELERRGEETERRVAAAEESRAEAERRLEDAERRRTEAERMREEAERAREDADRARAEAETSRDDAESKLRAELDRARTEAVDQGRADSQRLRAEADWARTEAEEARAESARLRSETEQARGEVERMRSEAAKAQADSDRMREDAERRAAEAERRAEAAEAGHAELERLRAETAALRAAAEQAGARARGEAEDAARRALGELQRELSDLRGSVTAARGAAEASERARGAAEAETARVRERLDAEVARLTNERDEARAESVRVRIDAAAAPSRDELDTLGARVRELTTEVEQAHTLTRLKGDVLASLSHEIRQPMNGIMGMSHLLMEAELDAEHRAMVEVVQKSSAMLLGLINDTLDLSKLETGRLEMEHIGFDLRVTVDEIMSVLGPVATERHLRVASRVGHAVPSRLVGDPGRLRQVLLNLGSTAIKFTTQGEIRVLVDRVSEEEDAVELRFAVHDTGLNLSQEQLLLLFESYTKEDPTVGARFASTGLALSIARRLVATMGGTVGLESRGSHGVTFWCQLRLQKQSTAVVVPDPPNVQLRGLNVLVVDPSRAARESVVEMLMAWGCRSSQAETGEEALQMLRDAAGRNEPHRVVLVDMQLPGMDSEQLAAAIRSDAQLDQTLLMLLTSVGRRGDAQRAQSLGFSAYMLKPVQWAELYDAMVEVVARGPVPDGVQGALVTRHSLAEARRGRLRILLVEDNAVNRLVANWALQRLGYALDVVESATAAIEACERQAYDLVFMDFQMPDMDGLKAGAALRARERTGRRMPIVMMTGTAMPGDRERALAAGMDDFIVKPIDLGLLCHVVERFTNPRPGQMDHDSPAYGEGATATTRALPAGRAPDEPLVLVDVDADASAHVVGDGLGAGSTAETVSPLLDTARLEESCMGIPALREALLQTFLNDVGDRMSRLSEAAVAQDARRLEFEAHNLKGMCATIGATGCAEVFAEIERMAKDEIVEQVQPLLARASDEVAKASDHIRRLEGILSRAA